MLMCRNVAAGIGSNEQGEYCRAAQQRSDCKEPRYKWPTLLFTTAPSLLGLLHHYHHQLSSASEVRLVYSISIDVCLLQLSRSKNRNPQNPPKFTKSMSVNRPKFLQLAYTSDINLRHYQAPIDTLTSAYMDC